MENESQVPQTAANPTPEPTPAQTPGHKFSWALFIIVILILALAAGGALYLRDKTGQNDGQDQTNNPPPPNNDQSPGEEPLVSGLVEWKYPTPVGLFFLKRTDFEQYAKYYLLGSFKSGTYAGKKIYVALLPACEGPCGSGALKLVEGASPGKYVVLKNHSTPLDNFQDDFLDYNKFTVDSSFKIPDLAAPVTLSGTKAGQTLVMAEAGVFQAPYELFNAGNLKFVYNDPKVGPVYTTPDNADFVDSVFKYHGFYVKSPDWNTLVYTIKPSFLEKDRPAQIT